MNIQQLWLISSLRKSCMESSLHLYHGALLENKMWTNNKAQKIQVIWKNGTLYKITSWILKQTINIFNCSVVIFFNTCIEMNLWNRLQKIFCWLWHRINWLFESKLSQKQTETESSTGNTRYHQNPEWTKISHRTEPFGNSSWILMTSTWQVFFFFSKDVEL